MTQKTSTARIITAATMAVIGAAAYRDQVAVTNFADQIGDQFDAQTTNAKGPKPVFEIHEREVAKREFALTLMRRNNANHLTVVSSIKLGLYGKRLDKPAAQEQEAAPSVVEDETAA